MEPVVRLLDQNTANQIAAGEVVEKPASVVKELVENSLDAQATNIEVKIYEGGTEYIRVTDNGIGMNEDNAKLSVLRHATSKIKSAEDLLRLNSLGFRGEALPSIASVSEFAMLTRPHDSEFATNVIIEGGDTKDFLKTGGNVGTSITVKNLFFNVPARRKFLKTTSTEGRYINEVVSKIALSRPDVRFSLINNDKEIILTPGNNNLVDTIGALYGKNISENLISVDYLDNGVRVSGYISKPTILKGSRQWQTIFVNGRTINSRMISKAIDHAYQSQIPKAGFPFAVLNIELDSSNIDVNVHPQKSEVKFSDEGSIYKIVYHGLTNALTNPLHGEDTKPEYTFNTSNFSKKHAFSSNNTRSDSQESFYRPRQEEIWKNDNVEKGSFANNPVPFTEAQRQPTIEFQDVDSGIDRIWPLGQIDRVFIVAQSENALYLIDQHAAHERVMYDKLIKNQQEIPTQQFLVPIFIDATPQEISLIEEHREEFLKLGVDLEAGGESILRISSLPSDIKNEEAEEFVREILKLLFEQKEIKASDLRTEVLHYTACHSAIRAGEVLNMNQMRVLILELLNTEHPFTCPHGRPCMIEVTSEELYKMFKRT